MTGDETTLEAAHVSIKALIAAKVRYLVPMTIIFVVGYIGLTVLAGFAKGLLGTKIVGSVNLGFMLIAANYVISWVLAMVYVRVASDTFDPLARQAASEIARGGR